MMDFHKYEKIYTLGHEENQDIFKDPNDEIIIEEKIDGANFRFMRIDDRIIFGSRSQSLGDNNQEIGGNWTRCVRYLLEKTKENLPQKNLLYFGECCVKHSMNYDWDLIPPYLGFDILENGKYVGYDEKKIGFEKLGLEMVPLIGRKKASEMTQIKEDEIQKSAYAEHQAEGLVFKNYEKQLFGKFVTKKFKEVNREAFGMNKKYTDNDNDRVVAMYCTNPRIDKHIFELMNEGYPLQMSMMQMLPKRVIEDIMTENWKEILYSKYRLDLQKIRKRVADRCKTVLQQMIFNNALQQKME